MDAIDDVEPNRDPIRAAGGLVVRGDRVLLVHRPRFDDWSLPKGKLKRGEHPLAGAVREVREETGVVAVPGVRLPTARYEVWSGAALVAKLVDYWAMGVGDVDAFIPGDEVDEIAWLTVPEALRILSYPRDVHVVRAFSELPPLSPPVVLLRALDAPTSEQAAALAALLALLRPGRLVGADRMSCESTLAPLAEQCGVRIEIDERFAEGADPEVAATVLRGFATADTTTVVCGLQSLSAATTVLRTARSLSREAGAVHRIGPGDGLVLSFAGDTLVAVDPFSSGVT